MEASKKLLIKYAVKIAAACNSEYETLTESVLNIVYKNSPFTVDANEIEWQIQHDTCSPLFFDYGLDNPQKIKNIALVKKSFAEIWFYTYIAKNYETMTFLDLKNMISEKYKLERELDSKISEKYYLDSIKKFITSSDELQEFGQVLSTIIQFADEALKNMTNYFKCVLKNNRFLEIYSLDEPDRNQKKSTTAPVINKANTTSIANLEEMIKSLKSDKLFMDTKIHKMQVDMKHMKKDIIREIMSELTNPAYGYPLSELYLYSKDEQLPESVRGTIKNLFATFSNTGIKLLKTTELGDNITYDENASKKYDIYKYHEFKIGDEVFVCYPGYRYEKEIIIKPIVKRKDV